MISPIIRQKVEERFGGQLRYHKVAEALSVEIQNVTGKFLSPSTLKRVFGFIGGGGSPREYTLDVIAEFCGYQSYLDILEEMNFNKSVKKVILELDTESVPANSIITLHLDEGPLVLEKIVNDLKVVSRNAGLSKGDQIKVNKIRLHYPLFISELKRNQSVSGEQILSKIGGVSKIEIRE